ncbi:Hypothetical protein D9617_20g028950 [Elsinoe fawcettii]|nr:Hypothetical protein D9617_20g028950 [Elsinoe fawcettii]
MATSWVCARCVRRSLEVSSRSVGRQSPASRSSIPFASPRLILGSTSIPQYIRTFSSSPHSRRSPDDKAARSEQHDTKSTGKRKNVRNKTSTSLRRVAVEAQRTRDIVRGSGRRQFIDPEADTKDVTASCAAEQYDLPTAQHRLKQEGYDIDPLDTGLYPQVIHVQTPIYPTRDPDTGLEKNIGPGDVFVFPSGSVVSWNVPEKVQKRLVRTVLYPAAVNPHLENLELEDMEYLEDPSRTSSQVVGDAIVLGSQANPDYEAGLNEQDSSPETDLILAKVAFSSGLARSTKLAVLENLLSSYFETTKDIPTILSRGSKLRFTRSFILRKTGELLSIRAQLNLYSELTDTMPDLFWDSPSQLGLSDYYDQVGRALDVNARIRTLNEKMDYASEIASVLRERLSEKHSTGLEWLIIFLISVEVGFELLRLWREEHQSFET